MDAPVGTEARLRARPRTVDGAAAPLLLMLHGAGADASSSHAIVGTAAAARGIVVVAPSSTDATWDVLTGFGPDVTRIDALLEQAFADAAIDPGHIAIAGFSDGASYALTLGIANGDLFTDVFAFSPGFAAPPAAIGRPRI